MSKLISVAWARGGAPLVCTHNGLNISTPRLGILLACTHSIKILNKDIKKDT
jgi:hypothetical protein